MKRLRETRDECAEQVPLDAESKKAILELHPTLRLRIGIQWHVRATAELRVAGVFSRVSQGLLEHGADPQVLRIAARAVSDEVRHASICASLAHHYLDKEVDWPAPGVSPMPKLAHAPAELKPTLHAVAMGCVNETIASAWLESSLRGATVPAARAAIRELIADDIHHARMGWAHLASSFVSKEARQQVGSWLPALLEAAAKPWTLKGKLHVPEGAPEHAVPSEADTLRVTTSTVHHVILPGFEALGVSTLAAREWCARTLDA